MWQQWVNNYQWLTYNSKPSRSLTTYIRCNYQITSVCWWREIKWRYLKYISGQLVWIHSLTRVTVPYTSHMITVHKCVCFISFKDFSAFIISVIMRIEKNMKLVVLFVLVIALLSKRMSLIAFSHNDALLFS
jgi:hypothetical protein